MAAALLLAAGSAGAGIGEGPEGEDLLVCVATGLTVYLPPFDLDADIRTDGDWYIEIPVAAFRRSLRDNLRRLGVFQNITLDPDDDYDVVLRHEIVELRRAAVSSDQDLGVRMTLSLEDKRFGQAIWLGEYSTLVEANAVRAGEVPPAFMYQLLVSGAVSNMMPRIAADLNDFFGDGGLIKSAYGVTEACEARTRVEISGNGAPASLRNQLLRALSDSPCFALTLLDDGVPPSGGEIPSVGIEPSESGDGDELVLRFPGTERRWEWDTSDSREELSAKIDEALHLLTEYHHRDGPCPHTRFDRTLRGLR